MRRQAEGGNDLFRLCCGEGFAEFYGALGHDDPVVGVVAYDVYRQDSRADFLDDR
jgi:hypothetical protein